MAAVTTAAPAADSIGTAHAAGLRWVDDSGPGLRRLGRPGAFRYVDADGRTVDDAATLQRIRDAAIPPAWTDVWICPRADGHIQATGRDARRRKQYRYHARWREVRDEQKFTRMLDFGRALPRIRARVAEHLGRNGLGRERVLAAVVRLLDVTYIRVGNDEYAKENGSFGLTTLRRDHVDVRGSRIRFRFKGKAGVRHEVALEDRRLARILARCQDLPGEELFEWRDDDDVLHPITADDVNDYLREISGGDFTSKDFRTWAGTVLAWSALRELGPATSKTEAKRQLVAVIKDVSGRLRNTPAVCRRCYIHPDVLSGYSDGSLVGLRVVSRPSSAAASLSGEERAVLRFLRSRGSAGRLAGGSRRLAS